MKWCFASWVRVISLAGLLLGRSGPLEAQPSGFTANIAVHSGQRIAFLGDSITALGWINPGGYVHLVVAGLQAEGVNVVPIPAGVSGNTSKDMRARLKRDVLDKKPDWMTLSCGVNDVWHGASGVDLPNYEKNITAIIKQAQAQGIQVMVLTSTGIWEDLNSRENQKLIAYNDFLRRIAREKNCPLADLNTCFRVALTSNPPIRGTNLLTVDGVHPNPAGHLVMAEGILKAWGLPELYMPTVQKAWNDIPDGAFLASTLNEPTLTITLGRYETLERVAQERHIDVSALANGWFLEDLMEARQESSGKALDMLELGSKVRTKLEAQLAAAAPAPSANSAPSVVSNSKPSPAASIVVRDGEKVIFVGDDITRFGLDQSVGYVRLVLAGLAEEGVKVTAIPGGIPGLGARDAASDLQHLVLDHQQDWMTIDCGIADALAPFGDLADYEKNFLSIVDRAQANGIKVLILTPTPFGEIDSANNQKIAAYSDFLQKLAAEKKCLLADVHMDFMHALSSTPPTPGTHLLTVDGFRWNAAGNRLAALSILKAWGVPDSDIGGIKNAWDQIVGAEVTPELVQPSVKLTLGQYQTLEGVAQAQHMDVNALAITWYLHDLDEACSSLQQGAPDYSLLTSEVQKKFEAQVVAAAP